MIQRNGIFSRHSCLFAYTNLLLHEYFVIDFRCWTAHFFTMNLSVLLGWAVEMRLASVYIARAIWLSPGIAHSELTIKTQSKMNGTLYDYIDILVLKYYRVRRWVVLRRGTCMGSTYVLCKAHKKPRVAIQTWSELTAGDNKWAIDNWWLLTEDALQHWTNRIEFPENRANIAKQKLIASNAVKRKKKYNLISYKTLVKITIRPNYNYISNKIHIRFTRRTRA